MTDHSSLHPNAVNQSKNLSKSHGANSDRECLTFYYSQQSKSESTKKNQRPLTADRTLILPYLYFLESYTEWNPTCQAHSVGSRSKSARRDFAPNSSNTMILWFSLFSLGSLLYYLTMSTIPDGIDVYNSHIKEEDRNSYKNALAEQGDWNHWKFEVVDGYFKQLLPETDETTFDYFKENFGKMKPWEEIFQELDELNEKADDSTVYKLFFLGRHGQGFHNLANLKYGEKEWNRHWLRVCGDDEMTWAPDPELTELGLSQAKDNHHQVGIELKDSMKLPTKWYSSPFRRSIDTLIGTWQGHVEIKQVSPLIKEDFRETIGIHICDKRSPRSVIEEKYAKQGFRIEDGFVEEDIYFKDNYREKVWEQALRMNRLFNYIFDTTDKKKDQFVSITSHSGSIRTQLMVLGHRAFAIGTGGMIPVLVKASRLDSNGLTKIIT